MCPAVEPLLLVYVNKWGQLDILVHIYRRRRCMFNYNSVFISHISYFFYRLQDIWLSKQYMCTVNVPMCHQPSDDQCQPSPGKSEKAKHWLFSGITSLIVPGWNRFIFGTFVVLHRFIFFYKSFNHFIYSYQTSLSLTYSSLRTNCRLVGRSVKISLKR